MDTDTIKLVRGRYVMPDADTPPIEDGAVVVRGGAIVELTGFADAASRHAGAEVIGSGRSVVMPGLINAHHHSHAVSWIQHGLPEQMLEPYLLGFPAVRDYSRYDDALICGARLLSTGVTSTVDLFTGGGDAGTFARDVRALARGYNAAGLRVAIAAGMSTRSFLVYGDGADERFIASLPDELRPLAAHLMPGPGLSEDEYFDVMGDVAGDAKPGSRVSIWYGAPGPEWVSDAFLQRIVEHATQVDTGVQTHAVESFYTKLFAHREIGEASILHLDRLGVLGPRFSLAHGVWLDEAEIAVLARTGASVSHNPGSNLRLYAGIAPVNAMRAAGITVGIGMDANTLNDDEDMFQEMRLALRLHREPQLGAPSPLPADILRMATTGGARLMRCEQRRGRLAPGCDADIVLVDLDRVQWPWAAPECDPLTLVMLRAGRQDVDTVLVGGEVVYRDGAPTRFDLAAAGRAVADQLALAAYPAERVAAARRLRPHLEAWYRSWEVPELRPYSLYNSRK